MYLRTPHLQIHDDAPLKADFNRTMWPESNRDGDRDSILRGCIYTVSNCLTHDYSMIDSRDPHTAASYSLKYQLRTSDIITSQFLLY